MSRDLRDYYYQGGQLYRQGSTTRDNSLHTLPSQGYSLNPMRSRVGPPSSQPLPATRSRGLAPPGPWTRYRPGLPGNPVYPFQGKAMMAQVIRKIQAELKKGKMAGNEGNVV